MGAVDEIITNTIEDNTIFPMIIDENQIPEKDEEGSGNISPTEEDLLTNSFLEEINSSISEEESSGAAEPLIVAEEEKDENIGDYNSIANDEADLTNISVESSRSDLEPRIDIPKPYTDSENIELINFNPLFINKTRINYFIDKDHSIFIFNIRET